MIDDNNTMCSTMIPPSPLAPDGSSCWQWWDAFEDGKLIKNPPRLQKGCDYQPCEDAVCDCDSYCCEIAWDLSCRGYELEPDDGSSNFFSSGCSAKILCCEQETAYPKSKPIPRSEILNTTCTPGAENCCATMSPPSIQAPDNSSCWQWWDAFVDGELLPNPPSAQKGCDYEPCQEAVCACDDYCCRVAWDLSCRGYELEPGDVGVTNYFAEGCSARLLCCEQDSAFPKPPMLSSNSPSNLMQSPSKQPVFSVSIPISVVPITVPTLPAPPNFIIEMPTANAVLPPVVTQQPTPTIAHDNFTAFPIDPIFNETDPQPILPNVTAPNETNICSTMIPQSEIPPNDSNCWQWFDPTDNNIIQNTGCDYKPCQDAVCACDSYCCHVAWDLSCRGYNTGYNNYYVNGCSASLLCCEQDDSSPKPPLYVAYSSIQRFDFSD